MVWSCTDVVYITKSCRSKQCFECWRHGQLSAACPSRGSAVYKCAGAHRHNGCTTTAKKCASCIGDREAWNRVRELKKNKIARHPTNYQTSNSSRAYFQNAARSLRNDMHFPRLRLTMAGPVRKGRGSRRGGHGTPDITRTAIPTFRASERKTSQLPTRSSVRNWSPSKIISEAANYEKGIADGEINDSTIRTPLSQYSINERIAVLTQNKQKRRI